MLQFISRHQPKVERLHVHLRPEQGVARSLVIIHVAFRFRLFKILTTCWWIHAWIFEQPPNHF